MFSVIYIKKTTKNYIEMPFSNYQMSKIPKFDVIKGAKVWPSLLLLMGEKIATGFWREIGLYLSKLQMHLLFLFCSQQFYFWNICYTFTTYEWMKKIENH